MIESCEAAVTFPDAGHAMAMLRLVLEEVITAAHWGAVSVSALPRRGGSNQDLRPFSTIASGSRGIFEVIIDPLAGTVSSWEFPFDDRKGKDLEDLSILTADPEALATLKGSVLRSVSRRRNDIHNSALFSLLTEGSEEEEGSLIDDPNGWYLERRYSLSTTKLRLHQARFRAQLLRTSNPVACAICGLDVAEILEAAHIMSDATGGEASSANGRLLCPNHHKAYDHGMYEFDADKGHFKRVPDKPRVAPDHGDPE